VDSLAFCFATVRGAWGDNDVDRLMMLGVGGVG
jgi:hypothetical protein